MGSYVVLALLAKGHDVAVLLQGGDKASRLDAVRNNIRMVDGDLGSSDSYADFLRGWKPDAAISLAWYAEPGKYLNAITENLASLDGSLKLAQALFQVGCRRVVMAGTCAEYDMDAGFLKEDGLAAPTTVYGETKLAMCRLGLRLAAEQKADFVWARLFYLFGGSENAGRLVPDFKKTISEGRVFKATKGEQVRDYIHIKDAAEAFVLLAECGAGGIYNVCSGVPLRLRDFLLAMASEMGKKDGMDFGAVPYRAWEPMFVCGDNSKLKSLGWVPRDPLDCLLD